MYLWLACNFPYRSNWPETLRDSSASASQALELKTDATMTGQFSVSSWDGRNYLFSSTHTHVHKCTHVQTQIHSHTHIHNSIYFAWSQHLKSQWELEKGKRCSRRIFFPVSQIQWLLILWKVFNILTERSRERNRRFRRDFNLLRSWWKTLTLPEVEIRFCFA